MCVQYVNTNVQCFNTIKRGLLWDTGFSSILSSVKAEEKDNKFVIGDFSIVTFINIRGTQDENNTNNPLVKKSKLSFRIRLTKVDKDPQKQLSYDIKDFDIDLSDRSKIHSACFDYLERIEITNIEKLVLESKGAYAIKILIKDETEDLYNIQMVHPIYVE